jgi:hypothetical protein
MSRQCQKRVQMREWVEALRAGPPPFPKFPGNSALPLALMADGQVARVGLLNLLGIEPDRFLRERERGLLDVFRVGRFHALEVPPSHSGPATDYLLEGV